MSSAIKNFLFALSFLTRLGGSREFSRAAFQKAIPWFGFAGILCSVLSTCAAIGILIILRQHENLPVSLCAAAAAWIWLVSQMWLTRAMHWDGLADIGDALGSGASGETFWRILKDSRLGAFGALTMFMTLLGQWLALWAHFETALPYIFAHASFWAIPLSGLWGCIFPVWLGYGSTPKAQVSLGALICGNISCGMLFFALFEGLLCLLFLCSLGLGACQILLLIGAQTAVVWKLKKCASRFGGLSGDFFGAGMEISRTIFLWLTIA